MGLQPIWTVDEAYNLELKAKRLMAHRTKISRQVTYELPCNNFEKEKQPIGVPVHSLVVGRQGTEGSNSVVPRQTSGVHIGMLLRTPTIDLLPTSATGVVSLVIIQVCV